MPQLFVLLAIYIALILASAHPALAANRFNKQRPTPTPTSKPTVTPSLTISPTPTPSPIISTTPTPIPNTSFGNDISFPQCGTTLPSGQSFGIVGVNDGLATTTNPCLSSELKWSNNSLGNTNQVKEQLYVNTADPGGLNTASWPKSNTDPSGVIITNPYGFCDGSNSAACSWQYGWNRGNEDVQQRFLHASQTAGVSTSPASYMWWLDIETQNTWESGSSISLQYNTYDIEGMVAYFHSVGATVGIYSTSYQWGQIVGSTPSKTLGGLNNWIPGASSLSAAKSNCSLAPLTAGGKVTVTQYTTSSSDFDYSCI